MSLVVFLSDPTVRYDAKLISESQHVMRLIFNGETPKDSVVTSGFFIINEYNYSNMSGMKYSGYTTLYRKERNEIFLSDDGSTYIEPVKTIDEIKEKKIDDFSNLCNKNIINGVSIELSTGETKTFSYNIEDQTNIKELFDLALQTNVAQYYHADGESCREYSVEDIIKIYTQNAMNKISLVTYFNQMKLYILSLEDIDIVEGIMWGDELTGEYLETYQNAIAQAVEGIEKLLGQDNETVK